MFGIPELTRELGKLTTEVSRLVKTQLELVKALNRLIGPPTPVGKVTFRYKKENGMAIVYEVDLPQLPGEVGDVVKGVLSLKYNGEAGLEVDTEVGQLVVSDVTIQEGVEVSGEFYFVDDAGNKSENPTVVTPFTVVDDIAPPDAVGGLGFRAVGEA
jgi:hypothetical protein